MPLNKKRSNNLQSYLRSKALTYSYNNIDKLKDLTREYKPLTHLHSSGTLDEQSLTTSTGLQDMKATGNTGDNSTKIQSKFRV